MKRFLVPSAMTILIWSIAAIGQDERLYMGRPAQAWIELLKDKDSAARRRAAVALRQIGPEAHGIVTELIQLLKADDIFVRRVAAESIGRIGPKAKEAVPGLTLALKDKNTLVRKAAVEALGNIGPDSKGALPSLENLRFELLNKNDKSLQTAVQLALEKIETEAVKAEQREIEAKIRKARVVRLLKELRENKAHLRRQAVEALGRIGPETDDVVPALVVALDDENHDVREVAVEALGRCGPKAKDAVPALLEVMIRNDALLQVDPKKVDPRTSRAHELRLAAVSALKNIGPEAKSAMPTLLTRIKDGVKIDQSDGRLGVYHAEEYLKALRDAAKTIDPEAAAKARVF